MIKSIEHELETSDNNTPRYCELEKWLEQTRQIENEMTNCRVKIKIGRQEDWRKTYTGDQSGEFSDKSDSSFDREYTESTQISNALPNSNLSASNFVEDFDLAQGGKRKHKRQGTPMWEKPIEDVVNMLESEGKSTKNLVNSKSAKKKRNRQKKKIGEHGTEKVALKEGDFNKLLKEVDKCSRSETAKEVNFLCDKYGN